MDVKIDGEQINDFIKSFCIVKGIPFEHAFMKALYHMQDYEIEGFINDLYNETIERKEDV